MTIISAAQIDRFLKVGWKSDPEPEEVLLLLVALRVKFVNIALNSGS